jgi:hypothetical protein
MSGTGKRTFAGLLALLLGGSAAARTPSVDDLSAIDRFSDHFYGAIAAGPAVRAAWTVEPTVRIGGSLVLSLTVSNAANPRELTRPDIKSDPRLTAKFEIADLDDPPPAVDAREVVFRYRLTPRPVPGDATIPMLKYKYVRLNPAGGVWRFTAVAYPQPVRILPAARVDTAPAPVEGPESYFAVEPEPRGVLRVGGAAWLVPVLLVPFAVSLWVSAWRRVYPDAARLAVLRRNRAVRRALDRLAKADRAPDPAGEAATAVREYLVERFGVPPAAHTPGELAAAVADIGHAAKAEAYFRRCDAARFAPASDTGVSLGADGAALIAAWEGGGE